MPSEQVWTPKLLLENDHKATAGFGLDAFTMPLENSSSPLHVTLADGSQDIIFPLENRVLQSYFTCSH